MRPSNLLVDYGEVIGLPQPAESIRRMATLAELDEARFSHRYWQSRVAYDRGRPAAEYWSEVLDRDRVPADLLASLIEEDMRSWTHLNPATIDLLTRLHRQGTRLSLLSNAPHELAEAIRAHPAFRMFDHLLFSAHLRVAKPDPEIFRLALAAMDARPHGVTFVDDRAENIEAAETAGFGTVLFTSAEALQAEPGTPERLVR